MARGRSTGDKNRQLLIIKQRRHLPDEDGETEHGGAWKIAYADFVTAMMTFFLLMWLVNVTTKEQRNGIADYFNPVALSLSTSGADGMLAGRSVDKSGALTSPRAQGDRSLPVASPPVIASVGADDRHPAGQPAPAANQATEAAAPNSQTQDLLRPSPSSATAAVAAAATPLNASAAEMDELRRQQAEMLREQRQFEQVEREIGNEVASHPELRPLADSIAIQQTQEGLRIQIIDRPQFSMFALGSARMNEQGRQLVRAIAAAVATVPNAVSIAGHTDGVAYNGARKYSNWELSSDRANAARRELLDLGMPPGRIVRVEGRADLDPLIADNPMDPRNRRISITLMRRAGGGGTENAGIAENAGRTPPAGR